MNTRHYDARSLPVDVFLPFLTDSTIEGDDVSICSVRAEERGSGYRVKEARIYVQLQLQSTSSSRPVLRSRP